MAALHSRRAALQLTPLHFGIFEELNQGQARANRQTGRRVSPARPPCRRMRLEIEAKTRFKHRGAVFNIKVGGEKIHARADVLSGAIAILSK